jgi:hypothetical protein
LREFLLYPVEDRNLVAAGICFTLDGLVKKNFSFPLEELKPRRGVWSRKGRYAEITDGLVCLVAAIGRPVKSFVDCDR